ncbi:MAG: PEGA domain-containing protein [Phycisphaerae bacterium]|nr:PEGA domain-containing protein [Phycisphaerae bacterium]
MPVRSAMTLLLATICVAGCVERTLTINTAPEGAMVYLNDEEIGRTPVSKQFTWYGDYDVVIRMEGYKTLKTHAKVLEPWYQFPPLDFVSECLVPMTLRDDHYVEYELDPQELPNHEELVERAKQFKERTLYSEQ